MGVVARLLDRLRDVEAAAGAATTMVGAATAAKAAIAERLLEGQNEDGGFRAARSGGESHLEATAWASLALEPVAAAAAARGLEFLRRTQKPEGSWALSPRYPFASWATSLAAITLARPGAPEADRSAAARGANWVASKRGEDLGRRESWRHRLRPSTMDTELDPDLKGWTWFPGTFSWVEPTVYGLVVLRRTGLRELAAEKPGDAPIADAVAPPAACEEAERLLLDRACTGGGWNYGNRRVLGVDLPPYPDTTGIALVGLQQRRGEPQVDEGFGAMHRLLELAPSGLALAWAILASELHERDPTPLRARLITAFERHGFRGQVRSLALALLALTPGASAALRMEHTPA
jgi:hypothetical protein